MAAVWRTNEVRVACPQEGARLSLVSHSVGDTCQSHRHGWVCILALFISGENIHFLSVHSGLLLVSDSFGFVYIYFGGKRQRTYFLFIYLFSRDISFGEFILDLSQKSPQYQNPLIEKWLSLSPPLLQRINRRLASDTDGRGGHNRGSGSAGEKLSLLTGESEEIHYSCSPTRSSSESNW